MCALAAVAAASCRAISGIHVVDMSATLAGKNSRPRGVAASQLAGAADVAIEAEASCGTLGALGAARNLE